MRLREREKRDVLLRAFTGLDDDVYTFGEGVPARASVYPLTSGMDARVTGEQETLRLRMLYDGGEPLQVGMGVTLADGLYRIVSLNRWAHQEAVLERMGEGRYSLADST